MKENYLRWNIRILKDSLKKISRYLFVIVVLDLLFYLFLSLSFSILKKNLEKSYNLLPSPESLTLEIDTISQALSQLKNFYYTIIFSIVIFGIAFIIASGMFKSIAWALTAKIKITFPYIAKFFAVSSIFAVPFFLLAALFFVIIRLDSLFGFISFMAVTLSYFGISAYALFTRHQKISSAFDAVKLNIKKIHLFVFPYGLLYLGFYSASYFFVLLSKLAIPNLEYIYEFFVLFYFSVARYYLLGFVKSVSE